jgi:3D-(3,5/4)-trihydroxycyclohexane-1,2-dione acylhydrolase (decyclizing)
MAITDAGGAWWDVAVPEISSRETVVTARVNYEKALAAQRVGD